MRETKENLSFGINKGILKFPELVTILTKMFLLKIDSSSFNFTTFDFYSRQDFYKIGKVVVELMQNKGKYLMEEVSADLIRTHILQAEAVPDSLMIRASQDILSDPSVALGGGRTSEAKKLIEARIQKIPTSPGQIILSDTAVNKRIKDIQEDLKNCQLNTDDGLVTLMFWAVVLGDVLDNLLKRREFNPYFVSLLGDSNSKENNLKSINFAINIFAIVNGYIKLLISTTALQQNSSNKICVLPHGYKINPQPPIVRSLEESLGDIRSLSIVAYQRYSCFYSGDAKKDVDLNVMLIFPILLVCSVKQGNKDEFSQLSTFFAPIKNNVTPAGEYSLQVEIPGVNYRDQKFCDFVETNNFHC